MIRPALGLASREGVRPTATGNSDTHSLRRAPAIPRNYVWVANDAVGTRPVRKAARGRVALR